LDVGFPWWVFSSIKLYSFLREIEELTIEKCAVILSKAYKEREIK